MGQWSMALSSPFLNLVPLHMHNNGWFPNPSYPTPSKFIWWYPPRTLTHFGSCQTWSQLCLLFSPTRIVLFVVQYWGCPICALVLEIHKWLAYSGFPPGKRMCLCVWFQAVSVQIRYCTQLPLQARLLLSISQSQMKICLLLASSPCKNVHSSVKSNKLHTIKPLVNAWYSPTHHNRWKEAVFACLQQSHTKIISWLLDGEVHSLIVSEVPDSGYGPSSSYWLLPYHAACWQAFSYFFSLNSLVSPPCCLLHFAS